MLAKRGDLYRNIVTLGRLWAWTLKMRIRGKFEYCKDAIWCHAVTFCAPRMNYVYPSLY